MLQEKRKDLDGERQKRLLQKLVGELSRAHPEMYYLPTSEIALQIQAHIARGGGVSAEDRALLQRLSLRDIEVLLSLH